MMLAGQRLQPGRYTVVPRTLTFLRRADRLLLLRIAPDRGAWAGKLNGIGGHVERGEDAVTSARRELLEEIGVRPHELALCGVILIDVGETPGIGLFVFVGEGWIGEPKRSAEGSPELVPISGLASQELVEDLPFIIPRALQAYDSGQPFSARYRFAGDRLQVDFGA